MILGLFLLLAPQDGAPFESKEYGIKLTIPAGWTIDATRRPHVILKLSQKGDREILVYEIRPAEPITLGQYREQLRLFVSRTFKECKIIDDRAAPIGTREGFVFTLESLGTGDTAVVSTKGLWCLSPKRFIAVDAAAPRDASEALLKVYDQLVASLQWMARDPVVTDGPAKKWPQSKEPVKVDVKDDLEIAAGDKTIGTYAIEIRNAIRDGVAGYEFVHRHKADYGEEGREESSVRGFVSADLSRQAVEFSLFRVGKDKRSFLISASAELREGQAAIKRRINGERSEETFAVAPGTIFSDAVEAAQIHLLELGKGLSTFPVLNLFDSECAPMRVDMLGLQKTKINDETQEIYVVAVEQDERVLTYWYDAGRKLVRIVGFAPSVVVRRKK